MPPRTRASSARSAHGRGSSLSHARFSMPGPRWRPVSASSSIMPSRPPTLRWMWSKIPEGAWAGIIRRCPGRSFLGRAARTGWSVSSESVWKRSFYDRHRTTLAAFAFAVRCNVLVVTHGADTHACPAIATASRLSRAVQNGSNRFVWHEREVPMYISNVGC
jgi:hypothetical protein